MLGGFAFSCMWIFFLTDRNVVSRRLLVVVSVPLTALQAFTFPSISDGFDLFVELREKVASCSWKEGIDTVSGAHGEHKSSRYGLLCMWSINVFPTFITGGKLVVGDEIFSSEAVFVVLHCSSLS